MKKIVAALFVMMVSALVLFSQPVEEEKPLPQIRVAALKGPTAMGLVEMMENGGEEYTFTIEASPDAIVSLIAKGEIDIAAVPANLAAVLYNNTGNVEVVAVNTLGVLYLVGNGGSEIKSRSDLVGKTIYSAGKGSTPQYALESILSFLSLEDGKDVNVEWKSEHAECVAALLSNPDAIAMLPQPFATSALMQNKNLSIILDLNDLWKSITGSPLITGCAVVRKGFAQSEGKAVEVFLARYKESVDWVNGNVDEAALLVEKYGIIKSQVAKNALPYCNIVAMTGEEMKKALEIYLGALFKLNPKSVGGTIPGDEFYF